MRRKRRRRRRRETVEEHGSEWRHDLSAKKQQHKKQTSLENNRKPSKQEGTVGFCVYKRRIWPLPGESATREQRKVARRRKKNKERYARGFSCCRSVCAPVRGSRTMRIPLGQPGKIIHVSDCGVVSCDVRWSKDI